jgi:hypothetical protein
MKYARSNEPTVAHRATGAAARHVRRIAGLALLACAAAVAQPQGLSTTVTFVGDDDQVLQQWDAAGAKPRGVDVVIEVRNVAAQPSRPGEVTVLGQWRVGPRKAEKAAAWTTSVELKRWSMDPLEPDAAATVRIPVDVSAKLAELARKGTQPYELRIAVVDSRADVGPARAVDATLPIRAGETSGSLRAAFRRALAAATGRDRSSSASSVSIAPQAPAPSPTPQPVQ